VDEMEEVLVTSDACAQMREEKKGRKKKEIASIDRSDLER